MEAKPFNLQSPEKVAEAYGGNKQKIAQAIQMGAIDPTSGLLAGMFIDRMRGAQAMERAPQQTVAQQVFAPPAPPAPPAGLGAIAPQGGGMPAPQGPQMASAAPMGMPAPMGQPPVGMAEGGLTALPLPDDMYNEESFAGGGIVAFAGGRKVDAKAEQIKALMSVMSNPRASFEDRMAARAELNRLESTTGPGLSGLLDRLDETTGAFGNPMAYGWPERTADAVLAANLREADAARGTDASGGMSLRSPELAAIDAASRIKNEAAGRVPFKGFGSAVDRTAGILGDAEINTYGSAEAKQRDPRTMGSINNLGETTRTLAAQFSPPPSDPTGLNALIASNNPNVRLASDADKPYGSPNAARRAAAKVDRERGAMVAPPPRSERGVAGSAPRAPTTTEKETTPAAGTDTPSAMTLGELEKMFNKAGEPPEFQRTSAEELAARKNEDLWSTLAQIGFGMAAGESPNFLTNVGKATAAATPAMQEAIKERRKDTKEERNREFDYLVKKAGFKSDNLKSAYSVFNSMQDREQRLTLEQMRIDAQEKENRLNRAVQTAGQNITKGYYSRVPDQQAYDTWYMSLTPAQRAIIDAGKASRYARNPSNVADTRARVESITGKGTPQPPAGFEID
jgi:hypothetical protein